MCYTCIYMYMYMYMFIENHNSIGSIRAPYTDKTWTLCTVTLIPAWVNQRHCLHTNTQENNNQWNAIKFPTGRFPQCYGGERRGEAIIYRKVCDLSWKKQRMTTEWQLMWKGSHLSHMISCDFLLMMVAFPGEVGTSFWGHLLPY